MNTREIEILRELEEKRSQLRPLSERIIQLNKELRDIRAKAFIEANHITREDVEFSSGSDRPFFGTVWVFAQWLKNHSTKNYAEWNTVIYRIGDLCAGRMPEMPATIKDLPAAMESNK